MLQPGALFFSEVVIAGSDGSYFPWANFIGLIIAFISGILLIQIARLKASLLASGWISKGSGVIPLTLSSRS
jgi:hypothetical protein